jgi:cytochrome c5
VRNYDLDFLKKFSMVIGFLVLVTVGLQFLAFHLNKTIPPEVSAVAVQRTHDRIAPLGAVYAGATGAAAQAAASAASAAAAASQVAYGGTKDGKVIFGNLCTGCHSSGAGGAPTLDTAHWAARIAQGKDTLYNAALHGLRAMPPKGGNPALTEDQVKATVDWMVSQVK